MKVLIINSAPKFTGEAAHCVDLTEQLVKHGHEVLLVLKSDNLVAKHAKQRGFDVAETLDFANGIHPVSFRNDFRKLRQLIISQKPDIVHCHRGNDHGVAAAVVATLKVKPTLVRTRHRVIPVRLNRLNRLMFLSGTDGVISVSQCAAQSFGPMLQWMEHKHSVIYSSADTRRFHPDCRSEAWRQQHGLTPDNQLIGLVARLQRVKGQTVFLRAAAKTAKEIPSARFLIAGSGPAHKRPKLEKLATELGIGDRVIFEEWLPDVHQIIAALDVGVLASLGSEGSSRITYEYMASGLPIIATSVGCIPEVITNNKTGLVVPPGDPDALADAMIQILKFPDQRQAMAQQAFERSQSFHNRDRWLNEILSAYERAIKQHEKPREWKSNLRNIFRFGQVEATHKSSRRFRKEDV